MRYINIILFHIKNSIKKIYTIKLIYCAYLSLPNILKTEYGFYSGIVKVRHVKLGEICLACLNSPIKFGSDTFALTPLGVILSIAIKVLLCQGLILINSALKTRQPSLWTSYESQQTT